MVVAQKRVVKKRPAAKEGVSKKKATPKRKVPAKRKAAAKKGTRKKAVPKIVYPDWVKKAAKDPRLHWVKMYWDRASGVPGSFFDQVKAQKAVDFFPAKLKHTEGEWAGRSFKLAFWQDPIIRFLFGWHIPNDEEGSDRPVVRLYRQLLLWIPRKNGKTEFAAGLALMMLLGDAEYGGQVYSIATDKDQAAIVFNKVATMIGFSYELASVATAFKDHVFCEQLKAVMKPLSGKVTGKHGYSASGLIGDEAHEWANDEVYTFVHQSSGARAQPLEAIISTAGKIGYGYGWELYQEAENIANGVLPEQRTLAVIYAANDNDDWKDEKVWARVNPNIGVSPKWAYLRSEFQKALQSPRREGTFKRYHLNMWTEQATRWIRLEDWRACSEFPLDPVTQDNAFYWRELPAKMRGRKAYCGVDLSSVKDITAVVLVFPPEEPGERWVIIPWMWVPKKTVDLQSGNGKNHYETWVKHGALTQTAGNQVDYDYVEQVLLEVFEQYDVEMIAYDRWNAGQLMTNLKKEELPVHPFGQGFASLNAPSKEFERRCLAHSFEHGNHPVLTWMCANLSCETDAPGNVKPSKETSGNKIDGLFAAIMAIGVEIGEQPEEQDDLDDFLNNAVMSA